MLTIAHRGYSGKFIDNTIQAFLAAIEAGFDVIELDIQLCASGDIVVFHDTYIGNTLIIDMSLDEIRSIYPYVPTLLQVFKQVKHNLYFDVKGTSDLMQQILVMKNLFPETPFCIASFNERHLQSCKVIMPDVKVGLITENVYIDALCFDVDFFVFHWTALDNINIAKLHNAKKKVFSYSYKEPIDLAYMKKFRIDGIVSNHVIKGLPNS